MSSNSKKENGALSRRDFLKAISAIGGAAVISSGCSPEPLDKLVSYAIPPENVIPGKYYPPTQETIEEWRKRNSK